MIERPQNRGVVYLPSRGVGLAAWGGIMRAKKLKNALQLITSRFNHPLRRVGQNQKWTTSGPSSYMHAFFVFSKIGKKYWR